MRSSHSFMASSRARLNVFEKGSSSAGDSSFAPSSSIDFCLFRKSVGASFIRYFSTADITLLRACVTFKSTAICAIKALSSSFTESFFHVVAKTMMNVAGGGGNAVACASGFPKTDREDAR